MGHFLAAMRAKFAGFGVFYNDLTWGRGVLGLAA